ncbi:ATP-binding protein [Paraburkholderia sp. B3]|uniref:ATP-binding response regulator n=1 Tax=Paraburkholderia sp. B3 TaxID=3134791 RepID=UPI0039826F26
MHLLVWIVALAPPVAAVGYVMYANLLNPRVVQRITGNYDGLYWDAAQLQIAYARLESQLLLYANGTDLDLETLRLRYAVLQSKLNVMKGSTRSLVGMPALMQRQQADLASLDAAIASFDAQLAALDSEPARIMPMVEVLREHWSEVTDLSLNRRYADIMEREDIRRDFITRRRELFAAGFMLLVLSAAAAVLLVMNGYRRTRLLRQQHAALEAEHQASRAAREASTAKDAFLGMISHELRTPLHAIVSSIELLGFNSHSEADHKVIQRLDTAARQLEAQMKDLTDYARLGAGKLELREEPFDPRELLQSIVDQNEAAALGRGLAFEHAWRGAAQQIVSDPHRIRQIANNLVTNAIRYTERGKVCIEFVLEGRTLAIVVSDTGPGVLPEQIPLIFKEFTQLDSSRSRRYEGAGMGLAIVSGLVALFGGTIGTDSRVGEGTTFTVTLPVAPVEALADAGTGRVADDAPRRPRVLVVDDNPLVRESLCEMAAHMGYAPLATANADSALALVSTQSCDVVLLDLHMPGRDGYAFVAGLDAGATTGLRPPVIVVSADVAALTAGGNVSPFFDYLTKPVHYEELRRALQRALAVPRLNRD